MKIQRFKGRTAQEALEQARLALGPEALILQTRRVQASGLQGLVTRPQVEVLAAVDTPPSRPPRNEERGTRNEERGTRRESEPASAHSSSLVPRSSSADWQSELAALREEMASLRQLLSETGRSGDIRAPRPGAEYRAEAMGGESAAAEREAPRLLEPREPTRDRGPLALEELAQRLRAGLVTRPIEIRTGECTVVALVGPTGVGKTTTIAKLAAVASRVERKRVAFISADTYRIGAVEQLQTYAQLLEIPMSVAYCTEDVKAARERYVNYDLVLMDTVGRAPSNYQQLEELASLLDVARPNEVHLALDARGSYATQESVLRGFRSLRPTHLLLSKLDETPQLEDSLAAALEGGLPLSYVTTGQRVPEDLAAADGAQLAAWLLGGR
jgi:flagellar biosynthesis protein FlhF